MSDDKTYEEKSTSETKTKTGPLGGVEEDAAGEPIKETTTTTEGKEESDKDDQ